MNIDPQLGNLIFQVLRLGSILWGVALAAWYLNDWRRSWPDTPRTGVWKLALAGALFISVGAFSSAQPKLVLNPPERQAIQPQGEVQRVAPPSHEERERRMRELDAETDARTIHQ